MNINNWRILDTEQDLKRINLLLSKFMIAEVISTQDSFIKFGYKNISDSTKITYLFLRDLALLNHGIKQENPTKVKCKVSLEYLSIALGTTAESQSRRIRKLNDVGLVKTIRTRHGSNQYIINLRPLPDTTFEKTVRQLFLRRECYSLIQRYKKPLDEMEKSEVELKLLKLKRSPFCREIIDASLKTTKE